MNMKPDDKYIVVDYIFILGLFILALVVVLNYGY